MPKKPPTKPSKRTAYVTESLKKICCKKCKVPLYRASTFWVCEKGCGKLIHDGLLLDELTESLNKKQAARVLRVAKKLQKERYANATDATGEVPERPQAKRRARKRANDLGVLPVPRCERPKSTKGRGEKKSETDQLRLFQDAESASQAGPDR